MDKQTYYYTYIVECSDNTYYVGMSKDVWHRLKQHNGKKHGGARYTKTRQPVVLKYCHQYPTHKDALLREIAIKKMPRKRKEKLIQGVCLIGIFNSSNSTISHEEKV